MIGLEKIGSMLIVSFLILDGTSQKTVDEAYQKINRDDGIQKEEAIIISQHHLFESDFAPFYQIKRPDFYRKRFTKKYEKNYWILYHHSTTKYIEEYDPPPAVSSVLKEGSFYYSKYMTVIDKKEGHIVCAELDHLNKYTNPWIEKEINRFEGKDVEEIKADQNEKSSQISERTDKKAVKVKKKAKKIRFQIAPEAPEGYATVYAYRYNRLFGGPTPKFIVNGTYVFKNSNKTYSWFYIEEGKSVVKYEFDWMTSMPDLEFDFEPVAGEIYYMRFLNTEQEDPSFFPPNKSK